MLKQQDAVSVKLDVAQTIEFLSHSPCFHRAAETLVNQPPRRVELSGIRGMCFPGFYCQSFLRRSVLVLIRPADDQLSGEADRNEVCHRGGRFESVMRHAEVTS